jgi:hypothetical protein
VVEKSGEKAKWGWESFDRIEYIMERLLLEEPGTYVQRGGMIDYNNGWDIYGIIPINIFSK